MKKSLIKQLRIICFIVCIIFCNSGFAQEPPDTTTWHISELSSPDAVFPVVQQRANSFFAAHPEMDSLNPLEKQAFKRWEDFWRNRANIDGASVPGTLTEVLNAMSDSVQLSFQQDLNAIVSPSKWKLISPVEFETQNLGTVTAIWVKPGDINYILIGTETSGLWKTTDGGQNWVNITDGYAMANNAYITAAGFGVSYITVNQSDINEIYISTFLPSTELVLGHGANILKSINGGTTWKTLDSYSAFISNTSIPNGTFYKKMVWKIIYNYTSSGNGLIYAALGKQLIAFNTIDNSNQYKVIFELGIDDPSPTNLTENILTFLHPYPIYRKIRDFEIAINNVERRICLTTDGIVGNTNAQAEVYHVLHSDDPFNGLPYQWIRKDLTLSYDGFIDNAAVEFYEGDFYIAYDEKKSSIYSTIAGAYFNINILNTLNNTLTPIFGQVHNWNTIYPDLVNMPQCSTYFNGFGYRYDVFKITNNSNPLYSRLGLTFYVGGFNLTQIDFESLANPNPVITSLTYQAQASATNNLQNENFNKNKYCHNGIRTIANYCSNGITFDLFIGNEGGISKYNRLNNLFTNLNGKGLAITQFANITSTQNNKRDIIIGGAIRNGLWHYEQGKNNNQWRQFYWEDGGNSLINNDKPENIFNCTQNWDISSVGYAAILSGGTFCKTISGLSYVQFQSSNVCPSLSLGFYAPGSSSYFPPIEFPPTDYNTIYLGKHNVWESSDGGLSFAAISSNNIHGYPEQNDLSNELQVVKIAPSNPKVIYAAFADPTWQTLGDPSYGGKLYRGTFLGNFWNWTPLTSLVRPYGGDYTFNHVGATDIAINPINPDEVWISFNQFCRGGVPDKGKERVIHTTNGGLNWTDYSLGLTPAPVNCIKYYSNNGNYLLFIGTDVGVFYRDPTDNTNTATWKPLNGPDSPLPRCIVSDIEISYAANKLRISTLGRGIWETEIPCFTSATDNVTITITGNETWANDITYAAVKVNSGATLVIKSHVKISGNDHVTIDKDATLILDGGTLEACPGQMWGGVRLNGNSLVSQYFNTEHSKIIIQNNGTIKDAIVGIESFDSDIEGGGPRGGGIIETDISANFINNQIGILMHPFQNTDPVTNANIRNRSYFDNCNFIKDNTYHDPANYPFARFVEMNGIDRINITNSKFENNTQSSYEMSAYAIAGEGIKSSNSVFTLINSNFKNLNYGMYSTFIDLSRNISVKNCSFVNNLYGAYVMGTNNVWFTSNSFEIPTHIIPVTRDPYGSYGLYLNGCQNGYNVEGNIFTKVNGSILAGGIGMIVNNSLAPVKTVYSNTFTGLKYGFLAQQNNGGAEPNSSFGLKIKCNDFINCSIRDIAVTPKNALGISKAQGANTDVKSPAGNTFTHLGPIGNPTDFDNKAVNTPIYYHHQPISPIDPWVPKYFNNITPSTAFNSGNYSKQISCNPIAVVTGPVGPDLPFDPAVLNIERSDAQLQLNSAKLILQIWVDGGNTAGLQQTVELAYPWEAYELYNNLLSKSPYLSDEVMIKAIENEDVLPPLMLKLILLANPQAVRSNKVMDALYKRNNPFPEEWIDELMLGLEVVSPRNELEANVGYYTQQRQVYFDMLKAYYLADTNELAHDSLVNLLANSGKVDDAYELAFSYFSTEMSEEATALMENIPSLYNLQNDIELQMYEQSQYYLNLLIRFKNDGYNYENMDSELKNWIISTTENNEINSYYIANVRALRMLYDTSYHYYEPVMLPEDDELKMSKPIKSKPITAAVINKMSISPNPANDYFIVSYELEAAAQNASLEIYDAMGKKMGVYTVVLAKAEKLINCSAYAKGMYHCILRNNGQIIASSKFNVTH